MGNTRKDMKEAEQRRISQIGDFKQRLGGVTELPSGLIVNLFNPGGLQAFLKSDVIPNSLMGIIQESLATGKAPETEKFMKNNAFDQEMLDEMMTMMDGICMSVIREPKFEPKPATEEDRSDEVLYIDELPLDDKQFIFQWVSGGTRDLEQFRQERDKSVESVAAVAATGGNPFLSPRAMRG